MSNTNAIFTDYYSGAICRTTCTYMCAINIIVATSQFSHCYFYSGMRKKCGALRSGQPSYMCPISPTKCCPNFSLCEIRLTMLFVSLFNKAELASKISPKKHNTRNDSIMRAIMACMKKKMPSMRASTLGEVPKSTLKEQNIEKLVNFRSCRKLVLSEAEFRWVFREETMWAKMGT